MAADILKISAVTIAIAVAACSDSKSTITPTDQCINVFGTGETVGTVQTLMGSGDFTFDGEVRPAEVALYIFNLVDINEEQKSARIVYQFLWDNGDSFVSNDPDIILSPSLQLDRFSFSVDMTITVGTGIYEQLDGEQPFGLDAEIAFGPPAEPGGPLTAVEEFDLSGRLCLP